MDIYIQGFDFDYFTAGVCYCVLKLRQLRNFSVTLVCTINLLVEHTVYKYH